MPSPKLFKVTFLHLGKCYELYARHVASSPLWGFTEVAELVFEPKGSGLLVDPTEERLRDEFEGTRVLHLPMQSLLRVEEVERKGALVIRNAGDGEKITPFPLPPRAR
ncbi:MAG TPA: DUF1820 family protein [Rhodanobacteraceae bacterium]|nr:DUF1820 family protein [Rhodanobacteraceae bacterium]